MIGIDPRRDIGLVVLIGAMSLVAAGYPTFVAHPITLLAPVPLLIALSVLDGARLASLWWLVLASAMTTWTALLYLAMAGTTRGFIYSMAMYAPFAVLSFRIKRPEPLVLVLAVVTSALLCARGVVSWVRAGASWEPWQVYEGEAIAQRLDVLLPLVVVAVLAVPARRRWVRVLLLALIGVGVTSIVLTLQRAGIAMLAVLFVIGLVRNYWKLLPVLAAAVSAAWLVATQPIESLLERTRFVHFTPSHASRADIWSVALDALRESSWLGVGPGNSGRALQEVGGGHAHNGLVQAALEAGWPGGVLYAGLAIYVIVLAARLWWRGGQDTLWALSLFAYIGLSVFSAPLQRPDFTLILLLVVMAARERVAVNDRRALHAPTVQSVVDGDAPATLPRGERCAV